MRLRALAFALLLAMPLLALLPAAPAQQPVPLRFGMDWGSVAEQQQLGLRSDYGQMWAGLWNEYYGWHELGQRAAAMADQGIEPVVQWWYWGDSISVACVEQGCPGGLHQGWKHQAGWRAGAERLADELHEGLQGRPGVLVLETEFNKGGIESWEPFDALLAKQAAIFRARAPELRLVLGLGNWGHVHWGTFDRAAAAVDAVSVQSLRGSTRDTEPLYLDAVDKLLEGARRAQAVFAKPVLVTDVAWASHPDAAWEERQAALLRQLFARLPELKAAGVEGLLYRALVDHAGADPANYYGLAERTFGLLRHDRTPKPAFEAWRQGVEAERAAPAPRSPGPAPAPLAAGFAPRSVGNPWWLEVEVRGDVARVSASAGGSAWLPLAPTAWGTWATVAPAPVPAGAPVWFVALGSRGGAAATMVPWG